MIIVTGAVCMIQSTSDPKYAGQKRTIEVFYNIIDKFAPDRDYWVGLFDRKMEGCNK